jgi:protein TonB
MALAVGGMLNFRSPEQPPAQEPVASTAASPDPAEGAVSPLAETPPESAPAVAAPPESQPEPAPAQVVEIPAPVTAASSPAAGPSALPAAGTDTPSPGQPAKVSPAPRSFDTSLLRAKPAQPAAATGVDVPPPPSVPLSETEPVASSALPGAVVNPIATAPAPPPPSPQPRTGGHFQEPKLISGSPPALPALARERHVYGVVKMEATVAKDGAIKDVTVLSGDPILSSAAKNAVRKWRYKPAALNGEPIEAKVPIQVVFRPGQ